MSKPATKTAIIRQTITDTLTTLPEKTYSRAAVTAMVQDLGGRTLVNDTVRAMIADGTLVAVNEDGDQYQLAANPAAALCNDVAKAKESDDFLALSETEEEPEAVQINDVLPRVRCFLRGVFEEDPGLIVNQKTIRDNWLDPEAAGNDYLQGMSREDRAVLTQRAVESLVAEGFISEGELDGELTLALAYTPKAESDLSDVCPANVTYTDSRVIEAEEPRTAEEAHNDLAIQARLLAQNVVLNVDEHQISEALANAKELVKLLQGSRPKTSSAPAQKGLKEVIRERLLAGETLYRDSFPEYGSKVWSNAISNIQNPKYAGKAGPLGLVKTEDHGYYWAERQAA